MNPNPTLTIGTPPTTKAPSPNRARFFYSGAAILLITLMFTGFFRFYLHGQSYPGRPITPPIRTLIILHGTAMTTWMLVFLLQPLLIETGNRRAHMRLGRFTAVLAAVIVCLGIKLGIESARFDPPDFRLWGLTSKQFMSVPVLSVVTFGVFVALGVWYRRRPEIHRPLMLLSVLAVMPAAMDRIDAIKNLYSSTIWATIFGPFFSTLVIGLFLLILKRLLTGSFNRALVIGYAGLVIVDAMIYQLAPTAVWDAVANFLLR